ncbi:MAG: hypothetical protein ACP5KN_07880 [Armatimonadota bacterium]
MLYIAYTILLVLTVAVQRTWPGWLLVRDQGPEVVAAAVVSIALSAGPVAGCFGGLVGALLLGGAEGAWLGGALVAYMGLGVAVGVMRGTLLAERMLVAVLVVLVAAPLVELVRMLFSAPPSPTPWLLRTAIAAPYSAIVAVPIYAGFRALTNLLVPEQ